MSNHTYTSIASEMGVNKRTVQDWYDRHKKRSEQELGQIDEASGARVFSDSEREILLGYMSDRPSQKAKVAPVTVEMGNHSQPVALSVGVQSASLEQFRSERIRQQLANPREFMAGMNNLLDQLEEVMDAAEEQQEAELLQTRSIKRQAARRMDQFRRRSDEYRIKTDITASIQNTELEELSEIAQEANSMGKQPTAQSDFGQS